MIKFKNINGDVFLAVGSIKRKSSLNGEKSLSGTLFEGDDVLNKIDKGWSLEFDNEPYVVTYFERNDNDNIVEFDAIHKFFWDMNKDVLYFSWSGSHTAKSYLEQIFKDTGYQYALNFEPSAFEKDNWGMKNKLSLFNDVIDSMGGEFEINGTLVSIFKNVGSDLSTIVRHGFNLSDMSLENDNTDFVTYGEGFGAYADQENQTGERLHVTYTSPLAKTFGKLHAEPIDDQRYTIKDNLLQAIKDKVDGSFAISIKLSLYDLTAAGYPYKMANVGDWLLAIDENLDFKQKIRIISVDDEFATDGTRISYTVTCGDIGVVQKYQQANASLGQKVDSAYQNAQDAKESSIQAVIAANGKNTTRWFDSKEEMDAFKANEGDMAFLRTGDGEAMYIYTKMPDGSFKWVKRVDPDTGEQIAAGVDDAIKQAKSQAAQVDAVRASEAAVFQSEANEALSSAAAERAVLSSNATSMANSASAHADTVANSASAYAKAQANSALSSANSELAKAKQELGSEVSKAQSDIVATNNELAGKVSQSDYNAKTDDLTKKYGQVKTTADDVTTEVANYKIANDQKVSANTASIQTLNNQITSKVSQTDYDKETKDLEGKYSETKQTVDSISQTVTELQAKANAQGQVNQLMNTEFNPDLEGWSLSADKGSNAPYASFVNYGSRGIGFNTVNADASTFARLSQTILLPSTRLSTDVMSLTWRVNTRRMDNYCHIWLAWQDADGNSVADRTMGNWNDSTLNKYNVLKWENISIPIEATQVVVSFEAREGTSAYLFQPMLVFKKSIGDYAPGNYNNNARVAAVELGIDHITGLVNDPKNGLSATATLAANGLSVATKAQNDATTAIQTAKGVQTTVTNVQKDVKDLQSTTTQTAGQITDEIQDRTTGDTNTLTQAKSFTTSQITSYDTGIQSQLTQQAKGITASVGNNNLIPNSEFEPMGSKWYLFNDRSVGAMIGNELVGSTAMSPTVQYKDWSIVNGSQGIAYSTKDWYISELIRTNDGNVFSMSVLAGRSDPDNGPTGVFDFRLAFFDENKKLISLPKGTNPIQNVAKSDIQIYVNENITPPTGTYYIAFALGHNSAVTDAIYQPMLNYGSKALKYTPTYGTDSESTILQLFKDHWAIGIQDNSGKLISGINGDPSNTRIVGKQIALDGDVTVTGDFYAKGGNFKNLNASNITTGTINAAKINVINLDVSSLSGNITNFIKSYWNSAYSNVTIDSTGMQITSGKLQTKFKNGSIGIQTKRGENLGFIGTDQLVSNDTVDFLTFALNGYHTTKAGDSHYDAGASDFYGGDGFSFEVSNDSGTYTPKLRWNSDYSAGVQGIDSGWTFYDKVYFNSGLYAHGAPEHFRVSWTAWSDWGNYRNVSFTNNQGTAGIAVNGDNLILFGNNKRADGTTNWNV